MSEPYERHTCTARMDDNGDIHYHCDKCGFEMEITADGMKVTKHGAQNALHSASLSGVPGLEFKMDASAEEDNLPPEFREWIERYE